MDLNINSNKFTANYLPPCIDILNFYLCNITILTQIDLLPTIYHPVLIFFNFHLCNITVSLYLLKAPDIVAEGWDYKIITSHYWQVDHVVRGI